MYAQKLQNICEEKVQDAIDELCEEFELDVPYYPEVYWIGRSGNLDSIGLRDSQLESSKIRRKAGWSEYLKREKVILIHKNCEHHLNEEATHFVHLISSRPRFCGRKMYDWTAMAILVEMLGFFGSKFLSPERENPYSRFPDLINLNNLDRMRFFREKLKIDDLGSIDLTEIIIHQQGYSLGERMFYDYSLGKIQKKEINSLMRDRFNEDGKAIIKFAEFRKRFGFLPN